jgi:hypothetical protein
MSTNDKPNYNAVMGDHAYFDDWGVPEPIACLRKQIREYEQVLKMCEQDSHPQLVKQVLDKYEVKR